MRHKLKFFPENPFLEEKGICGYLDFVEREPQDESKVLVTTRNGTTVREVLKACKRELEILNNVMPCAENEEAIVYIQDAINSLYDREVDRRGRGVEGHHLP